MLTVAKRQKPTSDFGRRLREIRESKGVTQTRLAELAEMTPQAVAKYERGANEPTWPLVLRFAVALDVSTEAFREVAAEPSGEGINPAPESPTVRRGGKKK